MATIDIALLSITERLDLLERLWESLSQTPDAVRLTPALSEELDRRLDELEREGPTGIPLEDALQAIQLRHA